MGFFYFYNMKIEQLYELYKQSYTVSTDTRNIAPKSVFFALKGANFNGNKFALEALEKGASYAVVDEEAYANHPNIVFVKDVLLCLQELANYHREQLAIPIIGLTGSNGKTTSKELMHAVLKQRYRVGATKGNLNNHIGVPLTLLQFTPELEIGIVEMGANHHKEIELLASIAAPDYGFITNFGKAHLEGFGSEEGVVEAKSELYEFLRAHQRKVIVNPADQKQLDRTEGMDRIMFEDSVEYKGANPFVTIGFDGVSFETKLIGAYNFTNIAAAITLGTIFDVSPEAIIAGIQGYIPENNRSQVIQKGTNTIVLDAYNANPTSMESALKSFAQLEAERKVVVLGDMFELGAQSAEEHQAIATLAASFQFDHAFLVGAHFSEVDTDLEQLKNFEELKTVLTTQKIEQTTWLIKGSRGMALERVLELV